PRPNGLISEKIPTSSQAFSRNTPMTSEARSADNNQVERSSWTPVDAETVSRSLQGLIETAAEQGRDYKLIDAIFLTLTAFIAESGEDILAPSDSASSTRRLRPRYRARIEAVIDSLSDDEVSDFLSIGTRQVRAQRESGRS
ncbi:hypothetical protein AAIH18_22535, partial [Pantoea agglomerans]|uniref:hypothetical protein n=1 Tax=Enterobacter agglomerans TaxID=549 RepID=UPI003D2E52D5